MTDIAEELFRGLDSILAARVDEVGPQVVSQWDADLWASLDTQGFATIDPTDPDIGLAEFLALARAVGGRALGLPLVEAGLAAWMAAAVSLKLPDGLVVPALAHGDVLSARRTDGELVVRGRLRRVPWGRRADHVLAFADTPEGRLLVAVTPATVEEGSNLAGEPRDAVTVVAETVIETHVAPVGALTLEESRLRGAVLRAAQAAGAMDAILGIAVEYAGQREQFGSPIGSFQAVQQHLVAVAGGAAATRAAVESVVVADPTFRRLGAASAKVTAGVQSALAARAAHQILGAIGVTEEHRLQLLTRRLWSWQGEFGGTAEWSRYLTDRLVFPGGPGLWPVLTPPHADLRGRELGEVVAW